MAQIQQIALLHVNELIGKRKIAHTVVFLSIDSQQHRVTIANPLSGIQIKTYQDMEGYWRLGEAVVAL